jgi:hypothetical protein
METSKNMRVGTAITKMEEHASMLSLGLGSTTGGLAYYFASKILNIDTAIIISAQIAIAVALFALFYIQMHLSRVSRGYFNNLNLRIAENETTLRELTHQLSKSNIANTIPPRLVATSFEIHISYSRLRVDQMSEILYRLDNLYKQLYAATADKLDEIEPSEDILIDGTLWQQAERLLTQQPEDRLYISFAQTGNSIRIQIKIGPLLIDYNDADFTVKLPKKIVTAILALAIFEAAMAGGIFSVSGCLELISKHQQNIERQLDIDLKRYKFAALIQKEKQLLHELEEMKRKIHDLTEKQWRELDQGLRRLMVITALNEDITGVHINSGFLNEARNATDFRPDGSI